MSYLSNLEMQHTTARILRVHPNQELFLVEYPGLVLAISMKAFIAFKADDEWHISTEKKTSNTVRLHKNMLKEKFSISRWYDTKADLLVALKKAVDSAKN